MRYESTVDVLLIHEFIKDGYGIINNWHLQVFAKTRGSNTPTLRDPHFSPKQGKGTFQWSQNNGTMSCQFLLTIHMALRAMWTLGVGIAYKNTSRLGTVHSIITQSGLNVCIHI